MLRDHTRPVYYTPPSHKYFQVANVIIIINNSFYAALFSALEQTHCAHWHVILDE